MVIGRVGCSARVSPTINLQQNRKLRQSVRANHSGRRTEYKDCRQPAVHGYQNSGVPVFEGGSLCHESPYIASYLLHKSVSERAQSLDPECCSCCCRRAELTRLFDSCSHGQSGYNLVGKIGGDSGLTPAGVEYARRLAQFAKDQIAHEKIVDENGEETTVERPTRLWTSTLRRTKETAQFIEHNTIQVSGDSGDSIDWVQFRPRARRNLDELYAGTCDGMTYKEIELVYPEEFARRQQDKLSYRYPRGESYMDVTLRLEPVAQEMERVREPVLIIGHQGILRILYAYFMGLDRKDAPYVSIPLNHVIELTPHAYGCHEKRFCLMRKEEMLLDGQDEPVTSMPLLSTPHGGSLAAESKKKSDDVDVAANDPVMNPPSN